MLTTKIQSQWRNILTTASFCEVYKKITKNEMAPTVSVVVLRFKKASRNNKLPEYLKKSVKFSVDGDTIKLASKNC